MSDLTTSPTPIEVAEAMSVIPSGYHYEIIRRLAIQRDRQQAEIERLRAELQRVRDGVDYWSYCMSQGMQKTCPEKVEELMDFLVSLKITPYYMPARGDGG